VRNTVEGYLFIAPALIGFLTFTVFPVIASLLIGFFNWNLITPPVWAGLSNYLALSQDQSFLISLKNTVLWVIYYVPASIVVSLALALALNVPLRGITVFRSLFYLPVISPLLAVALLFVWLYNPDFGLINFALSKLGIQPIGWLIDERLALPSIAIMAIWKSSGYNMLIFLAALQGVPRYLYEAATMDGANAPRCFWYITLPLLMPATFFIIVISLIGAFQVFGEVYIMTSGGPGYATYTLAYYLWQSAFRWGKMGYASAISMIMFLLILSLTLIQFRFVGRRIQYDL